MPQPGGYGRVEKRQSSSILQNVGDFYKQRVHSALGVPACGDRPTLARSY